MDATETTAAETATETAAADTPSVSPQDMRLVTAREKMNILRRQLLITGSVLVIVLVLFFALSKAQYVTPEMRAEVDYEPALFNTVLLGKLVDADVSALVSGNENDQMLARNLALSADNELTAENAMSAKTFKPGGSISMNFTVTNGTSLTGLSANDWGDRGIVSSDVCISGNVAESDIVYKLEIITTMNLPLTFELYDEFTGTTYKEQQLAGGNASYLVNNPTNDENAGGYCNVFTVSGSAASPNGGSFTKDGERLLRRYDNAITVHRYTLVIKWPDTTTSMMRPVSGMDGDGNVTTSAKMLEISSNDLRDTDLMKEIDNIQIRLEVSSYVDNGGSTDVDNTARGILALSANVEPDQTILTNYDAVKTANDIVSFNAIKEVVSSNLKKTDWSSVPEAISNHYTNRTSIDGAYTYGFTVRNCTTISANWTTNSGNGKSDGSYTYTGDFGSYDNCHLAIGVTSGNCKRGKDRLENYDYWIGYDSDGDGSEDTFYKAENISDNNANSSTTALKTRVWRRDVEEGTVNILGNDEDAYNFIRFLNVNESGDALANSYARIGDFSADAYGEHQYTLYMVNRDSVYYSKGVEDFYLYAYTTSD